MVEQQLNLLPINMYSENILASFLAFVLPCQLQPTVSDIWSLLERKTSEKRKRYEKHNECDNRTRLSSFNLAHTALSSSRSEKMMHLASILPTSTQISCHHLDYLTDCSATLKCLQMMPFKVAHADHSHLRGNRCDSIVKIQTVKDHLKPG